MFIIRLKLLLGVLFVIALFFSCKKNDITPNSEDFTKDYTALKKSFFNTSSADAEVQKLALDIQRQDSIFKFLPEFVKKNGVPKWDKTIYRVNSDGQLKNGRSLNSSNGESQGVFLVPLIEQNSSKVKSYITAYKHNDSLYTYRLYNRDSLNTIRPSVKDQKENLLHTQAVFGFFEKSINGKESIDLVTPVRGKMKNANVQFKTGSTGGRINPSGRAAQTLSCMMNVFIEVTYTLEVYVGPDSVAVRETISVVMVVEITCSGGGGGGSCGCSGGSPTGGGSTGGGGYDPYGSGGGYPYWWNNYFGWPWQGGGGSYIPTNPADWQWWWTGGPSGPVGGFEIFPDFDILENYDDDPNYFEDDNEPITFDASQQTWPTINNVLSSSQFVEYDGRNCLVLTQEQIGKAGLRDLGYSSSYKTYTESNGVNSAQAKAGVDYIISKLKIGDPVIIGVSYKAGSPAGNPDQTTDHFIVITGSGSDANGNYFTFFDNATNLASKGASPNNKLYYNSSTGLIQGRTSVTYNSGIQLPQYTVTQIRKNKR